MLTPTWSLSTLQNHLTQWRTLKIYGKVWLSCQIHSNGAAGPRWCLQGSKMMANFPIHSLWQMELSKAMLQNCSAWCIFAMLTDAFQDGDNGIPIWYRFDGKLFNLRRMQAKSKVQTEMLDKFSFANDMAKSVLIYEKMQKGCGSSIWFLWQLWSHNQHKKDWGRISTST